MSRDKYDEAIDAIMESEENILQVIWDVWNWPVMWKEGCLFSFITRGLNTGSVSPSDCGCLTQIAYGSNHPQEGFVHLSAASDELTNKIRENPAFNIDMSRIREDFKYKSRENIREWLNEFAKYQRLVDAEEAERVTRET